MTEFFTVFPLRKNFRLLLIYQTNRIARLKKSIFVRPPVEVSPQIVKDPEPISPEVEIPRDPVLDSVAPAENQLAFKVDSPGSFSRNGKTISTFNLKANSGLGYYFLLNSGVALPNRKHDTSLIYKKYDPGFSANIAGGIKTNGFRIGMGGAYRSHNFHESSELRSLSKSLVGKSETFSGFLDLGYEFDITNSLDVYFGLGLGYYLSLIDDNKDLSTRKEHDFFISASTGVSWNYSELFSLSLGYRYAHENEVPAHLAELGLNFNF